MTVDLPTTSVVEFRRAAWPLLRRNTGGVVVMDLYLTWAALGASACILGFGLVGLTFSAMSWWFVLVGLVCTVLVARRIRGRLRRARTVRDRHRRTEPRGRRPPRRRPHPGRAGRLDRGGPAAPARARELVDVRRLRTPTRAVR